MPTGSVGGSRAPGSAPPRSHEAHREISDPGAPHTCNTTNQVEQPNTGTNCDTNRRPPGSRARAHCENTGKSKHTLTPKQVTPEIATARRRRRAVSPARSAARRAPFAASRKSLAFEALFSSAVGFRRLRVRLRRVCIVCIVFCVVWIGPPSSLSSLLSSLGLQVDALVAAAGGFLDDFACAHVVPSELCVA